MMRVGIGHDTHRLAEGRPLILGGVRIEHSRGLIGHSDADVVLHAVTDALLGAAGLGDVGDAYPDADPAHRDANSSTFLRESLARLARSVSTSAGRQFTSRATSAIWSALSSLTRSSATLRTSATRSRSSSTSPTWTTS